MENPTGLLYARTHEWVSLIGDIATIGITDHAQCELGDIVFLELPAVGKALGSGEMLGTVESVKAVSDLYSPVAGVVIEINTDAASATEVVNTDPYGAGWLVRVKLDADGVPADLLDASAYTMLVEESAH